MHYFTSFAASAHTDRCAMSECASCGKAVMPLVGVVDGIFESTHEQHLPNGDANPLWLALREGMVTGTKMVEICNGPFVDWRDKPGPRDSEEAKYNKLIELIYKKTWPTLYDPRPLYIDTTDMGDEKRDAALKKNEATKKNLTRGTTEEPLAKSLFKRQFLLTGEVRDTGIAINKKHDCFIADSADGVFVHNGIKYAVEVKSKGAALPRSYKPDPSYLYQCLSHCAIHDAKSCMLIVYSSAEGEQARYFMVRFKSSDLNTRLWEEMKKRARFWWCLWYGATDGDDLRANLLSGSVVKKVRANDLLVAYAREIHVSTEELLSIHIESFKENCSKLNLPDSWKLDMNLATFKTYWLAFFPTMLGVPEYFEVTPPLFIG